MTLSQWRLRWNSMARVSQGERRRAHPRRNRSRLFMPEPLEGRMLLSLTLVDVPQWTAQGPGPILDGQVEGIDPDSTHPAGRNPVAGAAFEGDEVLHARQLVADGIERLQVVAVRADHR